MVAQAADSTEEGPDRHAARDRRADRLTRFPCRWPSGGIGGEPTTRVPFQTLLLAVKPVGRHHGLVHLSWPSAGLMAPTRRGLTLGLVLTVTLVAFEALAVITILPPSRTTSAASACTDG